MKVEKNTGFTIIEIVVTMVLAAILIAMAAPGFRSIVHNNQMTTQANELVASLMMARSEAVKRGEHVSICASVDSASCNGSTNWETGWIVFTDQNVAGAVDGADSIIQTKGKTREGITLVVSGKTYIRYQPSGFVASNCHDCFINLAKIPTARTDFGNRMMGALIRFLPLSEAHASGSEHSSNSEHMSTTGSDHSENSGSGSDNSDHMSSTGSEHSGQGTTSGGTTSGGTTSGGTTGSANTSWTSGSSSIAVFTICDSNRTGETGRAITISRTGRASITEIACN